MIKHKLTKQDIKENPELKEMGLKPGDKIYLPVPGSSSFKTLTEHPTKPPIRS